MSLNQFKQCVESKELFTDFTCKFVNWFPQQKVDRMHVISQLWIAVFTGSLQVLLTKLQFLRCDANSESIQASSVTHTSVTEITWQMCHPSSSE